MSQQRISIAIDEDLADTVEAMSREEFRHLEAALTAAQSYFENLAPTARPTLAVLRTALISVKIEYDVEHERYVLAELTISPDFDPDPPGEREPSSIARIFGWEGTSAIDVYLVSESGEPDLLLVRRNLFEVFGQTEIVDKQLLFAPNFIDRAAPVFVST